MIIIKFSACSAQKQGFRRIPHFYQILCAKTLQRKQGTINFFMYIVQCTLYVQCTMYTVCVKIKKFLAQSTNVLFLIFI